MADCRPLIANLDYQLKLAQTSPATNMNSGKTHKAKADFIVPEVYERLCRARDFIDLCYDLPLNLEQISSRACFSRYHFLRLFREAFDKTPHQYLVERRIEKAKELLSARDLRVTDICLEVGFQSLGSFSSLFHKTVGDPPITIERKSANLSRRDEKCPVVSLSCINWNPPLQSRIPANFRLILAACSLTAIFKKPSAPESITLSYKL